MVTSGSSLEAEGIYQVVLEKILPIISDSIQVRLCFQQCGKIMSHLTKYFLSEIGCFNFLDPRKFIQAIDSKNLVL